LPGAQNVPTQWPPAELVRIRLKLDELAERIDEQMRKGDPETVVEWLARLLVVRSCGYLEQAVREVALGHIAQRSGGYIKLFATSWVPDGRNPWPDYLVQWVGRFDKNLSDALDDFLDADDERLRREVSFLVDRRNRIAHGLNEGIGARKALDLKEVACEVAQWFSIQFDPI
jgi:RiboL-PSP-HEPN